MPDDVDRPPLGLGCWPVLGASPGRLGKPQPGLIESKSMHLKSG